MSAGSAGGGSSSVFMCTPQSFPPTPVSRANVLARTSQFSDDLLFLARDQLRLRENLNGMDETTRATAVFLQGQQRLAVLDGNNSCEGIRLSCGHHRATKTGVSLYSSVRAMVPVLRNRYVYFQVSCVREGMRTPSIGVGLSTPEMPLSTLVGAFSNSIGLCSTGQVLMSSRWYGLPGEYALRKKGMSTVGVLVFLDGSHPFRSWDGDMVRARVYFSVDGRPVHVSPGLGPPIAPDGSAGDGASSAVFNDDDDSPSPKPQEQELEEVAEYVPSPLPPSFSHPSRPGGGGSEDGAGADEEGELSTSDSEEVAPWEAAAASAVAGARAGSVNGGCFGGVMDEESGAIVNVAGTKVLRMAVPACRARAAARSAKERKARGREGEDGKEEREIGQELASLPTAALAPGGSAALGLALPKDRDLFPTVTIHSAKTEIICRFCAPDLLKVSRESMGAPPEATIFALDGSLISRPVITPP